MMTEIGYVEHLKSLCNDYVSKCNALSTRHRNQAKYALTWWNCLGIFNVMLTSAQALTMTVQTVYQSDNISIAVTGGIFAFVIAVSSRIQMSFSFNSLAIQHHQVADDYNELTHRFLLFLNEIQHGVYDTNDYDKMVLRFASIGEKSHLQSVYECKLLPCCF